MLSQELNRLMQEYLNEFRENRSKLKSNYQTMDHHMINEALKKGEELFVKYWNEVYSLLSSQDKSVIKAMLKNFRRTSPTITYSNVKGFYGKYKNKLDKTDDGFELHFIVYAIIEEVYVNNYVERINTHILSSTR
jgi:hypothetical protein